MDETLGKIDETRIHAFEQAWGCGAPAEIESCLPDPNADSYLATLEELVHVDIEFQWKLNRTSPTDLGSSAPSVRLESYLERFHALNQPPIVGRLLQQEYRVRSEHGDLPLVEEYCRRFPELLASVDQAKSFLTSEADGRTLGRYQLLNRHARGGLGEVWRADDPVLGRQVALKQLSPEAARQDETRQRFISEARMTAKLEHPGVVPVYDLVLQDSESPSTAQAPSYAMKFLSGRTLSEAIDQFHETPSDDPGKSVLGVRLLGIYLSVVRTVQYAHSRRIIHRDLKPQNVMVGDFGEAIVVDWGLAKSLDAAALKVANDPVSTLDPLQTAVGRMLGTPAYMAPEQLENAATADHGSDIYALGGILYEVLTDSPPHTQIDMERRTRNDIAFPASVPFPRPRQLIGVCKKALAHPIDERYQSTAELANDLERYLADESIDSVPDSLATRLGRWFRKHRAYAIATLTTIAVILVALIAILAVVLRTNERLQIANAQTSAALDQSDSSLYFQRLVSAHSELVRNGNVLQSKAILDLCPEPRRNWEWHYVNNLCNRDQHEVFGRHEARVRDVAVAPGGSRMASVDDSGQIIVWDLKAKKAVWKGLHEGGASSVLYYPDGKQLVTAGLNAERKGAVRVWDAETGKLKHQWFAHPTLVWDLAFHPKLPVLATAGKDETIKFWDAKTFQLKATLQGHRDDVLTIAFNHDGSQLVSGSKDRSVRVWDVEKADIFHVFYGHGGSVRGVAFRPDGEYVASASEDRTVRTWDVEDKTPRHVLVGHQDEVYAVAYAADNTRLLSAGFDAVIHVWNSRSRQLLRVLRGHESHIRSVQLNPENSLVYSGADDHSTRVWKFGPNTVDPRFRGFLVGFHPDGSKLATGVPISSRASEIWVYDVPLQKLLRKIPVDGGLLDLHFDHAGKRVGYTTSSGKTAILDYTNGKTLHELKGCGPQMRLAFHKDDRIVAVGDFEGNVRLWDIEDGSAGLIAAHGKAIAAIRFSPDGKTLATGSLDHTVKQWDWRQRKLKVALEGHRDQVMHVAYSPDGKHLASASYDGTVKIWDSQKGKQQRSLIAGKFYLNCVEYSPDGSRIVAGSDQLIKFWDPKTGEQVFSSWGHNCVNELIFSPNGLWLAIAGTHKGVRLWKGVKLK